jgi:L-aspartate oxidase
MPGYHELAELAPRDIVSRAIFAEMKKTGSDHVLLDITMKDRAYLEHRFPTIFAKCLSFGIDISKDWIPVAPSQHYSMGGIRTDEWGRTGLEGFYAVGEAACNGIHGANRLASNSLLEGLVFGRRIARSINEKLSEISALAGLPVHAAYESPRRDIVLNPASEMDALQHLMTLEVGIIRDADGLQAAISGIDARFAAQTGMRCNSIAEMELRNVTLLSGLVARAAMARTESRGAHYRSDFPTTEESWHKNLVI